MKTLFPDEPEDRKAGYGNPPKDKQFKKGQSGNPKGRPKKKENFHTVILEEIQTKVEVKGQEVSMVRALIRRGFHDSLKGNTSILKFMLQMMAIHYNDDQGHAFDPNLMDHFALEKWIRKMEKHNPEESDEF